VEKIFNLGKTDTAPPFAMSFALGERDFHRARENKIKFAIRAKT
jgi:hypothetical protein